MNRYALVLGCLALGACATPPAPTAVNPPQDAAAPAPGAAPAAAPRRFYHGLAVEAPDMVVVRFSPGRETHSLSRGQWLNAMRVARTHRFRVSNEAERDGLLAELHGRPDVEMAEPDYRVYADMTANDPLLGQMWQVPMMKLPQAWDISRGGTGATVAVVDTGVNYNHADLSGRIIKGPDLVNNDADPMDDFGHGTHVAGTIAATQNNGAGISGVAPESRVLAIKALDSQGSGNTSDIADGIEQGISLGAKVISLSLGGPQPATVLKDAIAHAESAGVVVIASAGNDNTSTMMYPAGYSTVVAVGATGSDDRKASYSNYGAWVDVAAPGTDILSTIKSGSYGKMSGTSMAAPQVAGVASMLVAMHPDWKPAQVRQVLLSSGDQTSGFESNPALRRLNAYKALSAGGATPAPSTPTPTPTGAPTSAPTPAPTTGDTTAPVVSQVRLASLTSSRAVLAWTTNEPADGQVYFGRTTSLGSKSALMSSLVTGHNVAMDGLSSRTRYYLRARSRDRAGNLGSSPTLYFTTP